ncbi:hypothetical protein KQX54_012103 [Cotesia glomerata]|uniref:Uncharacterized protein n=1 Tax=Cotesia glomerata TaxID=32391 RepID=A0AAV7J6H9_COTGL|nr:hypothetical protein KQX54_012103 [Cotesia glomerata]
MRSGIEGNSAVTRKYKKEKVYAREFMAALSLCWPCHTRLPYERRALGSSPMNFGTRLYRHLSQQRGEAIQTFPSCLFPVLLRYYYMLLKLENHIVMVMHMLNALHFKCAIVPLKKLPTFTAKIIKLEWPINFIEFNLSNCAVLIF